MMTSRLDITQIFWDVDDFRNQWSKLWQRQKQLPSMLGETHLIDEILVR